MAYVIVENGNPIRIAANDVDKNQLNLSAIAEVKTISDSDFLKLKKNQANCIIDNNQVVIQNNSWIIQDVEDLNNVISGIKIPLQYFLARSKNQSKPIYSECQNYLNYLNSFDTSTVTFPLNKSWEEYCEENSIFYLHPLQIP